MSPNTLTECAHETDLRGYLDGALPVQQGEALREHIRTCGSCRASLKVIKAVDAEIATWRNAEAVPAGLRSRVLAAVDEQPATSSTPCSRRSAAVRAVLALAVLAVAAAVILPLLFPPRERTLKVADAKQLAMGSPVASLHAPVISGKSSVEGIRAVSGKSFVTVESPVSGTMANFFSVVNNGSLPAADGGERSNPTSELSSGTASGVSAGLSMPDIPRQIIYTAQVDVTVSHLDLASAKLMSAVRAHNGYIAQSNVDASNSDAPTGSWTIRIPVEQFDQFMSGIAGLGKLNTVHRDSQDVTDEYYDLQARIENKQIEAARLREYLERRTGRLSEILTVEQELSRVQGEIEEMQGRRQLLAHQSELSTVTVSLSEPQKKAPVSTPPGFGRQVGKTLTTSLATLSGYAKGLLLWLVAAAPWLVLLALVGLGARLVWRGRVAAAHED